MRNRALSQGRGRNGLLLLATLMLILPMSAPLIASSYHPSHGANGDNGNIVIIFATGTPPRFNQTIPPNIIVTKGVPATFNITVYDADNDPIHVEWSWGDGSPNATNDTPPAFIAQPVSQVHTWDPYVEQGSGNFYIPYGRLNITIDDGNGNFVTVSRPVQVFVPENGSPTIGIVGPSVTVDPVDNVTIFANASDPEGEPLTWTFVFNDTQTDFLTIVNHTGWTAPNALVWNNVSYIFNIQGEYTVTMYVSDALPPNQTGFHNLSQSITIRVAWNIAPSTSTDISVNPQDPILNSTVGYILVNYSVEAYDLDGDVLTATWNFGDGGPGAVNVSEGSTVKYLFLQTVNYTDTGNFNISVTISDGRANHTVTLYVNVTISSTNEGPKVMDVNFTYPSGNFAYPNESLTFHYIFNDVEHDPIMVRVDFGDGTIAYYNVTDFDADGNATLTFTHSFNETGSKKIEVMYTDNKIGKGDHVLYQNLSIEVSNPIFVPKQGWSWWDYTSLGMFLMVPVIVALRFIIVGQRRRRLEEKGLSLEEWKLIQSEMGLDDEKAK